MSFKETKLKCLKFINEKYLIAQNDVNLLCGNIVSGFEFLSAFKNELQVLPWFFLFRVLFFNVWKEKNELENLKIFFVNMQYGNCLRKDGKVV